MTCIVVDDNEMACTILENYCRKTPGLHCLASFREPETAIQYLNKNNIDLILLDIEMPAMNGFELLDKLVYNPLVIVVSAFQKHAFVGYQYQAVDYIQKPVSFDRFRKAVRKAGTWDRAESHVQEPELVYTISRGKLHRIAHSEIYYLEAERDHVNIVCEKETYRVRGLIGEMEEKIHSKHFVQVPPSYLVNLRHIQAFRGGRMQLPGKAIPVSRELKAHITGRLNIL